MIRGSAKPFLLMKCTCANDMGSFKTLPERIDRCVAVYRSETTTTENDERLYMV